jgi:uncharacterized membrane protein
MIRFFRLVIVLGGTFLGIGLTSGLYAWNASEFYIPALIGAFIFGTIAALLASFVK